MDKKKLIHFTTGLDYFVIKGATESIYDIQNCGALVKKIVTIKNPGGEEGIKNMCT